jgi:hypothetical protein
VAIQPGFISGLRPAEIWLDPVADTRDAAAIDRAYLAVF